MDILNTLKTLNSCFGPSGCETEIREKIADLARPFADEIRTDIMGNLIAIRYAANAKADTALSCEAGKADAASGSEAGKKDAAPGSAAGKKDAAPGSAAHSGAAPRLMFAAHMDSLGLIATFIEDSGLVRFGVVGGVVAQNIVATPVRFSNGTVGTIGLDEDAAKPEIDKMFIDIGAASRKEAREMVSPGDIAVYDTPIRALGSSCLVSPYADNRAGCVAQLLALEALKEPAYDSYFVFTVQEEVGRRGAKPAAFGIDPQYAIVCDCTLTDDLPWTRHTGTSKLGLGASVKVMDKSVICHPEMVAALKAVAEKHGIPCQTDVLKWGGTDGSEMRKNACGVYTGGVSVPLRYVHTPQEVCNIQDIEAAGKLMAAFAQTAPLF